MVLEYTFRSLFENAPSGMAIHKIIRDDYGKLIDTVIIEANEAFGNYVGLKAGDIIGRKSTEVIPGIGDTFLIEIFENIALTGDSVTFEKYLEPLQNVLARMYTGQKRMS